jgi:hypothetical protein
MRSNFSPNAKFIQTCGPCGCIFRVELERSRSKATSRNIAARNVVTIHAGQKHPRPQGDLKPVW